MTWHDAQATLACPFVSGNPVALWSNVDVAVVQLVVLWHVLQFVRANCGPADWCGGLLVCSQVVKWQPEVPHWFSAIVKL